MTENLYTFAIRGPDLTIRQPEADCVTHGAVVPMSVCATDAPDVSAQICPKCLVEFMGRTFPVTPRRAPSGDGGGEP